MSRNMPLRPVGGPKRHVARHRAVGAPAAARAPGVCLVIGLPAALVQALMEVNASPPNSPLQILAAAAYALGVAPLALAYASHLALLWRRAIWRDRLAWAIAPGRMALTNYLMQTVIAIALFHGIGLGLMGEAGPVTWPLIAGVVMALQAAPSAGGGSAGSRLARWNGCGGGPLYGRLSPNSRSATHSQS